MSELTVVSYGGGVQSTALLVLAAQGYIDHRTFLFANVGDDSELPDTLRYVREVAFDYAGAHGIEIHELHRVPKKGIAKGQVETLWGRLMREGSRSLPIPVRMGRVNSMRRMRRARAMGCNSADGTFVKYRRRRRAKDTGEERQGRGALELAGWLTHLERTPILFGFEAPSHPAHRAVGE